MKLYKAFTVYEDGLGGLFEDDGSRYQTGVTYFSEHGYYVTIEECVDMWVQEAKSEREEDFAYSVWIVETDDDKEWIDGEDELRVHTIRLIKEFR